MIKLYPSEELLLKGEENPVVYERKNSRYLLITTIIFVIVAWFYRYASEKDFILKVVFYISVGVAIISITAYIVKLYQANKHKGNFNYYLTNRRLVKADRDSKIVKEILLNKIKRVEAEYYSGSGGTIYINPKEIEGRKKYNLQLKGINKPIYSKDTFIIENVANAKAFEKLLVK